VTRALERFAARVDRLNAVIGRTAGWLTVAMVVITCVVVVARYFFDAGWIWLQESVTWMHALVFMLAAAWTLGLDEHVRVDVFYRDMAPRRRALVDLTGVLLLLIPFCLFLLVVSWDYVSASWRVGEASREAGGLPGLFLLKSVMLVMPVLLILQGVALAARSWLALRGASQTSAP
jgi:TRAP-type mannitol/chloroaromatic compound transport system permease small subunit